jgi:crotonobetainyl-CoA:carnitine CoA-transferase CaiB-like acyl-CoA transferase
MSDEDLVLGDIKVLDLSEGVAGPFCTKLLAGLGAEVVKVERPGTGDVSRQAGPFLEGGSHLENSALFLYLNTTKKSVTLDLENPSGPSIFRRLAQDCDILVESFPPGHMDRLGLGYSSLAALDPGLIYTSITPFGQSGPYRDYKGSDIVAQAIGALMHTVGLPDREPLRIGGNAAFCTTGMSAFSATMLALHARDMEGCGQHVDISTMETLTVAQIHSSIQHQFGRVPARRQSNLTRAQDGWVSPGLETGVKEETWARVCELMGVPELADDPTFNTPLARREHQQELLAIMGEWAATRPKEEIYHTFQGLQSIAGYVATAEDLLNSGQLKFRGFFQPIEHPSTGEAMYPGLPFRIEGERWRHSHAPRLGEHNPEVFCGRLGYTGEHLAELGSQGVI